MAVTESTRVAQVVGALACQTQSYLKTLEAEVISCEKRPPPPAVKKNGSKDKNKPADAADGSSAETWLIEFADSVLFPEGGGQPSDHGTITPLIPGAEDATVAAAAAADPIPIQFVERVGLRCVYHSPRPLAPGERVRQEVDFRRRWDHMQQHTGQHLLSAVMKAHDNGLDTLGWGMGKGGAMNYVDLPRRPSDAEIQRIQARCNEIVRSGLPITVETPEDAKVHKMPGDYDQSKGVVRVIRIGDIDRNTCCGTHLSQTSHISLILIHHGEPVHGTNFRLYFSAGDRAIDLATASIGAMGSVSRLLSCKNAVDEVVQGVRALQGSVAELKRREKKLLSDVAEFEADSARARLQAGKSVWVHRADGNADFVKWVTAGVKDAVAARGGVVVVATGEEKKSGQLVVLGEKGGVEVMVPRIKDIVTGVKGGGAGDKWQGKVVAWEKGNLEALKRLVEGSDA
ncbi:threonyl and Alanyl tRNA synthetase second additional domain-containing protein [Colletotrichum higginsianum]|uniref:Threonyl and Alanyl tRNA synthetase second additional domain-containing protein n=2 Tax=Colletotrichum higginsianum TaxID=80884 RepID=H1W1Q8_COLHI|nr:Threonyl and Alanyl tRNA synthetase second additional domain-containing protein [Colletotrichum higginsianum IMI 349063]OBR02608.1 Threonyl and Alanyl tRNA synthetase second additional domain-containing protein [Colletotrichum higginsianum IMI 349063]TID06691.1 putative alanyl-tRNA editing protein alaX [Colletotrichum higginsianum]CCF46421.1 threonyl and Alanyl tRNA synthetase second additional domain-containing protein [Colletotrichum higginsianum]